MQGSLRKIVVLLVVVFVKDAVLHSEPAYAQGVVEDIAGSLVCQCGCGKLLSVCEMETARQMKEIISAKVNAGWDRKQILDFMTTRYGQAVLAAPPKRGFDLTAWVTPFLAIAAGGQVIVLVLAVWVRRNRNHEVDLLLAAQDADLEAKYGRLLDQEMREFGE